MLPNYQLGGKNPKKLWPNIFHTLMEKKVTYGANKLQSPNTAIV